ncbi:MAG: hypothetical protein HY534_05690 [Chloroflexi bacterium]|nr:hypothetical protein [Chloroflexota bacterium]
MTRNLVVTALVATLMAGFVLAYVSLVPIQAQIDMPGMPLSGQDNGMAAMTATGPTVPPVKGYTEGEEIRFIHTEASDPQVAQMLTDMMGSPVLLVPSLAQAPDAILANVYVFTNGIRGEGPFGFQSDVFDHPPGAEGYSPLRAVYLVTWTNDGVAGELKSAAEVKHTEASGAVTIQRPGAVVNMPFLTWPGGQR